MKAVPSTVAACFYGDLKAFGKPVIINGKEAFVHWTTLNNNVNSFESEKLRVDLEKLGTDKFAEGWDWLIEMYTLNPADVKTMLENHFGPIVKQKYIEREKRGQG